MSFTFGNIGTKTKLKVVQSGDMASNYILDNHFVENTEYYLFLTEGIPTNRDLKYITNEIDKAGYESYIIASATMTPYVKKEVKQASEHMINYSSAWRELIDYNGTHVSAIMPFGPAIYSINKATDISADCFYDIWLNKPYYYLGHGYVGNFDTFIFPVDGLSSIWPTAEDLRNNQDVSPINWKTRFFLAQLKNMLSKKVYPDNMNDFNIICSTDEIDKTTIQSGRRIQHKAKDMLTKLLNSKNLAFDTETTGLQWFRDKLVCITLCNDGNTGYFIPWKTILDNNELVELLKNVFYTAENIIGANVKFDFHFIWDELPGFDFKKIKHIDDICQLSHTINSDRVMGLKPQTYFYTPFGGYDYELDLFREQTGVKNYGMIPTKILYKYATTDAIMTWRIFFALKKQVKWIDSTYPLSKDKPIDDWSMEKFYDDLLNPCYPDYIETEQRGMFIDRNYQLTLRKFLQERRIEYTKKLAKIWNVSEDFDFGSTKKLGQLIKDMGWPAVLLSDKGEYATSDDCIQEWKRQNRPGINELIALRETVSFLGTFIGEPSPTDDPRDATGWEQFIVYHPEDNTYRIHQNYKVGGTETFRNIGNDPNLQNIPTHSKLAVDVKRCITTPTSLHYTIESDDGNIYEGGELDTVEVSGKGRITLDKVEESDSIVPNSYKKFDTSAYDGFYESGNRVLDISDTNNEQLENQSDNDSDISDNVIDQIYSLRLNRI